MNKYMRNIAIMIALLASGAIKFAQAMQRKITCESGDIVRIKDNFPQCCSHGNRCITVSSEETLTSLLQQRGLVWNRSNNKIEKKIGFAFGVISDLIGGIPVRPVTAPDPSPYGWNNCSPEKYCRALNNAIDQLQNRAGCAGPQIRRNIRYLGSHYNASGCRRFNF